MTGPFMILLVDDNDDLRQVTRELLESLGHRVIEAQRAEGALRIVEQRGDDVDLLITELVFPGELTGLDLAQRLRGWKPELGVLFVSTHDNHGDLKDLLARREMAFLRKPYTVDDLLDGIRRARVWSEAWAAGLPASRSASAPLPMTEIRASTATPEPLPTPGTGGGGLWWRAGLSGVAVAAVVFGLQFVGTTPPRLPDQVVASTQRGSWIEPLAPLAKVRQAPRALRWTPVTDATLYRFSILAVDDSVIWRGQSPTASAKLPAEIHQQLQPRVLYTWLVEALDHEGLTLAHSGRLQFQIQEDPGPIGRERASQPPS